MNYNIIINIIILITLINDFKFYLQKIQLLMNKDKNIKNIYT